MVIAAFVISIVALGPGLYAIVRDLQDRRRRRASLDLDLRDTRSWAWPEGGGHTYGVDILAVNNSDQPGALSDASLRITYTPRGAGPLQTITVRSASVRGVGPADALSLPTALAGNGAQRGWFLFDIADGLVDGGHIERYEVVVNDSRGIQASLYPMRFIEVTE